MTPGDPRSSTSAAVRVTALLLALSATPASAWPLSVTGGGDYFQDSQHQVTRSLVAAGAMGLPGFDLLAAGIRYDSNRIGAGTGIVAGGGVGLGVSRLRVQVTRFVGDQTYRAWRWKVGPESGLLGARLGIFYTRDQSPGSPSIDGAAAEASVPLASRITARAGAAYGLTSDHAHTSQATLGVSWSPFHLLEIATEVGRSQGASTSALAPTGPTAVPPLQGLPILGGGGGAPTSDTASRLPAVTTGLLSLRVSFP